MQKSEKEIKNRVGIVMDEGYFYEGLTMNEMKSIIAPSYSEWDNSAYKNYMDMFSLDPNQNISTLSRGMKTKFALVLALSHKPELLIMDEPTSGLDPLIRNDLLDIIAEFMENGGKGVFFSTHITSDLDKIADTLIMIDNGTIIFSKSKDELLENYRHVKGDNGLINDHTRQLFLYLNSTQYGFTGITDDYAAAKKVMPDALFEKASIEEIMLAYIRGGHANA